MHTYGQSGRHAGLEEVEPEDDLGQLLVGGVLQREGHQVQAGRVAQEVVVYHVVRLVS